MILPGKGSGIFQLYLRFLTFFVQVPQRDFCLACEAVWHSKSLYISRAAQIREQMLVPYTLLLNEGIPRALKGKKLRLKIPRVLPSIFEFILVIQI